MSAPRPTGPTHAAKEEKAYHGFRPLYPGCSPARRLRRRSSVFRRIAAVGIALFIMTRVAGAMMVLHIG
jgi:hypothetical protein